MNYRNFVKYFKKVYKLNYQRKTNANSLKEEISSTAHIADKGWLLSKINEQLN